MSGLSPLKIDLSKSEIEELEGLTKRHKTPQQIVKRAKIILLAGEGYNNRQIMRQLALSRGMVSKWRTRWVETAEYKLSVWSRLQDYARRGRPPTFSAEQLCHLYATACKKPKELGYPLNRWTAKTLANELVKSENVESISIRHVGRLLAEADLKPHRTRYWMSPKPDEQFDEKIKDISHLYLNALKLSREGQRVISTDDCASRPLGGKKWHSSSRAPRYRLVNAPG